MRGGCTNVHYGNGLIVTFVVEAPQQQRAGALHRVGLDVDDRRPETANFKRGDPVVDVLAPRRREQHIDHFRITCGRAEHIEVDIDLFERVRDILIGFELNLHLHLGVRQ